MRFYSNREERSKWLAKRFKNEFDVSASVLDVGCYNADLKKHLKKGIDYTGIDIAGKPSMVINLDEIEKLPFKDAEFDTVVCADVLEHLENIHLIFDELCRVAGKFVIITLPNAYAEIPEFLRGKRYSKDIQNRKQHGLYSKYYGLPLEKPKDRHRWFFSYDEAVEFAKFRCINYEFELAKVETENDHMRKSIFKRLFWSVYRKNNQNLKNRHIIMLLSKMT